MPNPTHGFQNVSWDNVSTMDGFLAGANQSAGGGLFAGIDFMVFAVLFITIASTTGSWEIALMTSGFIGLMMSILLLYMGLVSTTIVGVFVGIIIVGTVYSVWNRQN